MKDKQKMQADPVKINMLGEFSISYGGNTINDSTSRSKKLWMVLEYMLAFRDREISQNELIELLWPDDNIENPANTLKTLIYRVRSLLDDLSYDGGGKSMLVYRRGACSWNHEINAIIDVDLFEERLKQAHITEGYARLENLMAAINLYKGDFLPKAALEPWAVPLTTYYHTKYLTAVKEAVVMLVEDSRYDDIINICQKATVIDPYDEELHYWLILALYNTGEKQQAMKHYEYVTDMFFSRFGVNPTERLTNLYKEIIAETNNSQMDLSVIKEELQENYKPGAFFCEYAIFKEIYHLNMRTLARTGAASHLCLLSLVGPRGGRPQQKVLSKTVLRLKECIGSSLRRGDVFTRYSVSQFLVMLPAASYENSVIVIDRIIRSFRRQNGKALIDVKASIQPMSPDGITPIIK